MFYHLLEIIKVLLCEVIIIKIDVKALKTSISLEVSEELNIVLNLLLAYYGIEQIVDFG